MFEGILRFLKGPEAVTKRASAHGAPLPVDPREPLPPAGSQFPQFTVTSVFPRLFTSSAYGEIDSVEGLIGTGDEVSERLRAVDRDFIAENHRGSPLLVVTHADFGSQFNFNEAVRQLEREARRRGATVAYVNLVLMRYQLEREERWRAAGFTPIAGSTWMRHTIPDFPPDPPPPQPRRGFWGRG